jgi:molybdopterin converting factor small subunit
MPRVILSGSIRQQAGGIGEAVVAGETAAGVVAALEAAHPALRGWVVDERGALRRHVKLFHRGVSVPLEAALEPDDELHIVAAISGG